MITALRSALVPLALTLCVVGASAQAPKVGGYYVDDSDLGFQIKMPKDWDFTPPQSIDPHLIGKYTPPFNKYVLITPDAPVWLEVYLIKFDRRKKAEAEDLADVVREASGEESLSEWLASELSWGSSYRIEEQRETKINKVPAVEYLIKGLSRGEEFNVSAVLYHLHEDVDVAAVFTGPAEKKKWNKFESPYKKMARTFKPIELKEVEAAEAVAGESPLRTKKRAELTAEAQRTPGWEVYETPHYFILSNTDDKEFLKEVQERLEAYRKLFDEVVSFDEAERLRLEGEQKRAEAARAEAEEEGEDEADVEVQVLRTEVSEYSPRDRSVCSVVRVCAKSSEYSEYGGPPGSAGYWWSVTEELVLYDAQMEGGRSQTFGTLAHEAFHQYIFYLYGGLAPHDWYNEGTADFFGGYEYKHKRMKLERNQRRIHHIQQLIRDEKHVPLDRLIRFSHSEYYGSNDLGATIGDCYAEGWSLVYFLRTAKKKCPDWDDRWDTILDTYYKELASTSDLVNSLEIAFDGVDMEKLEEVWKDFVLNKA